MNSILKITRNIIKFGILDLFFYSLKKINLISEMPVKYLVRRACYYRSLTYKKQLNELGRFYKNAIGKDLNIDNPQTFTEKIQWLKFYDSTRQKADYSDKYLAPKLISKKYSERIKIIPQLGVWEHAEDIDFDSLPQKFVLKCNHGSAMNIIVKDKSKLNIAETRKQLSNWLKIDYAYVNGMYENHYTYIDRKIIAEKFIEEMDGNLHDYKFHCFNGEPLYIEFIGDRVSNTHTIHSSIYTKDWKKADIILNTDTPYNHDFPRPQKLEEMLSLATDMAKDFCYVRVDFYYINNEIYFGELTFTPDAGIIKFTPPAVDEEWGKLIQLPQKSKDNFFTSR